MRVDFFQDKGCDDISVIVKASSRTKDIDDLMEMISSFTPSSLQGYSDGSQFRIPRNAVIRIYS